MRKRKKKNLCPIDYIKNSFKLQAQQGLSYRFRLLRTNEFSLILTLPCVSEDHAELGRVGCTGWQDLPAAGLELVGDGAIPGEGDLVGGRGNRPELENRYTGGSGDLNGAMHARYFGRLRALTFCGFGLGLWFGLLLPRFAFEPRQKTHGCPVSECANE